MKRRVTSDSQLADSNSSDALKAGKKWQSSHSNSTKKQKIRIFSKKEVDGTSMYGLVSMGNHAISLSAALLLLCTMFNNVSNASLQACPVVGHQSISVCCLVKKLKVGR